MTRGVLYTSIALAALAAGAGAATKEEGVAAFEVVKTVLQHPRCQNCHIPGDAPLQFDDGRQHAMNVQRGADGNGAKGLQCTTCHGAANPPATYGANTPPGAPSWHLPPAKQRMVFIGLAGGALCKNLQDKRMNGGKSLQALLDHVSHDKLVLWGWDPGVGRAPVSVPHDDFVAKFKLWVDSGAPCAP